MKEVTDATRPSRYTTAPLLLKVGDKVNEIGEVDDTEVEDSSPPPIAKSALESHVPGSLLAFGDDKTATVRARAHSVRAAAPRVAVHGARVVKPTRTEPWSLYAPTSEIAGAETKKIGRRRRLVRALAASAVGDKEAARLLAPAMEVLLPGRVEATIGSGEAGAVQSKQTTTAMRALEAATAKCRAAAWAIRTTRCSAAASAQLLWGREALPRRQPCGDGRGEVELVRGDRLPARGVLREEGVRLLPVLLRPGGDAQGLVKPRDVCHPPEEAVKKKGLGA